MNDENEMLLYPIKSTNLRGELIKEASVIIWNKGPTVNRAVLACVYEVCRTVMENKLPFGGKIIVILGDFRQTSCPVIRAEIDAYNKSILRYIEGETRTYYLSADTLREAEDVGLEQSVSTVLSTTSFPHHMLEIKINAMIFQLLQNFKLHRAWARQEHSHCGHTHWFT